MTYGAAYMLCEALLPVLATARLSMRYEDYAHSTLTVSRAVMVIFMLPFGWLLDRIGRCASRGWPSASMRLSGAAAGGR